MQFHTSVLSEIKDKKFFIASPSKEIYGLINQITAASGKINLIDYSEISFTVAYGDNVQNWEHLKKFNTVYVEDVGWFQLQEPAETDDGAQLFKDCAMYSLEYELSQRNTSFTVNTGTVDSLENIVFLDRHPELTWEDDWQLAKEDYIRFCHDDDPDLSLMHLLLEKFPNWGVGYIHPALKPKIRSFSEFSGSPYSFLMENAAKAFECIFTFDTDKNLINAYPINDAGDTFDQNVLGRTTDLYLGFENLVKDFQLSQRTEEDTVTAIRVFGGDKLDLRDVNLGMDYLFDLSHYYDRMSPGLLDKWKAWLALKDSLCEDYIALAIRHNNNTLAQLNLHTMLPEDEDSGTEDWTKYGINELTSKLKTTSQILENYEKLGLSQDSETWLNAVQKRDAVQAELEAKKAQLEELKAEEAEIVREKLAVTKQIDWNSFYTVSELKELTPYIKEADYTNDTILILDSYSIEEIIEQQKELKKDAVNALSRLSQPQYTISTSLVNLFSLPKFRSKWEDFSLGNFVTVLKGNRDFLLRLISVSFDFYNPDSIQVVWSNMYRDNQGTNDIEYLLKGIAGGSVTSISSRSASGSGSGSGKDPDSEKGGGYTLSYGEYTGLLQMLDGQFDAITSDYIFTKILEGEKGYFERLSAHILSSDYADIKFADIGELKAALADVESLLAGNAGVGDLQAIHLTADNAVIDEAVIKHMIAAEISVADLMAHIASAELITLVSSETGRPAIALKGATQQFFDSEGNVRVQIGQDGGGSFSFVVRGEDGTTALFDSHGIRQEGIPDNIIVNKMIAPGTIGPDRLDFQVEIDSEGRLITSIDRIYTENGTRFGTEFYELKETAQALDSKIEDSLQYKIEIDSSNGVIFTNRIIDTTLSAVLYRGNEDVTAQFADSCFIWTRQSGDADLDDYWNSQHESGAKSLHITREDLYKKAQFRCSFWLNHQLVAAGTF